MKLHIQRETGVDRRVVHPKKDERVARVDGACPGCGADPFLIQCHPPEPHDDRTWRAGARCDACDDPVGWVYFPANTLFGIEEDVNVLVRGRCRVY
jgi:hypothetical protein